MSSLAVVFDRTELGLEPLAIGTTPAADATDDVPLWLPEDGLTEPDFEVRTAMAPESLYVPGDVPLAASVGAGGLALTVYARGSNAAELRDARALLGAAVGQWRVVVATEVDGVVTVYRAVAPAVPRWGQVDSGMVAAHIARASLTIPVNPPA